MNRTLNIDQQCTQKQFGDLIGVTQKTVSELKGREILPADGTMHEWLLAYISHMREQAAGRATAGDLDLAEERARLAREQRIGMEMKNQVTRKEMGPIIQMQYGLSDLLGMVGSKMDGVVGELKKRCDLPVEALKIVDLTLAECRNDIANLNIDWFEDASMDSDESETFLDH